MVTADELRRRKEQEERRRKNRQASGKLTRGGDRSEAKAAGQEFIGAREKAASKLAPNRAPTRGELETASQQARTGIETARVESEQAEREAAGREFLEERQFFDETRPQREELDLPERTGVEKLPVGGAGIASVGDIIGKFTDPLVERFFFGGIPLRGKDFKAKDESELQALLDNPETARERAIQEIQKDVITEGTSTSEKFGAVVEAIPIIGSQVAKFAGRMVESPQENVDTLVSDINEIGNIATNTREKALTGKAGDPKVAFDTIVKLEQEVFKAEQRIRLLSLESSVLRADADQINRIETQILDTKQRLFDAKQSIAAGVIAPATDSNVFLTLQELKGG